MELSFRGSSLSGSYNVDALSAVPGSSGTLVAGLSSFVGREWTGAVVVVAGAAGSSSSGSGGLSTQALLPVRAGIASVACLPLADEFTGRRIIASGADDGSVDLWYLSGSAGATALEHAQARVQHDRAVLSLACPAAAAGGSGSSSSGGNQLAAASADGTLRLWDCSQLLACTAQLGQAGGPSMNSVAWTADHSVLATASSDGRLCLWDARQLGSSPAAAGVLGAPALSVAATSSPASPGQQLLVAGDQLGRVAVFDPRQLARPLQQRQLHIDAVHALAAACPPGSSSSGQVASGSDDGSILLLDCSALEASRQLAPARQEGEAPCYVRALAWSSSSSSSSSCGDSSSQRQEQRRLFRGGWDHIVAPVPL